MDIAEQGNINSWPISRSATWTLPQEGDFTKHGVGIEQISVITKDIWDILPDDNQCDPSGNPFH